MLLLAIIIITSPVIIVIITKLIYRPFHVLSFYTEDSCPYTVSFNTKIFVLLIPCRMSSTQGRLNIIVQFNSRNYGSWQ